MHHKYKPEIVSGFFVALQNSFARQPYSFSTCPTAIMQSGLFTSFT